MSRTHAERVLAGRAGAYKSWATTTDRRARTEASRQAFNDRFERMVPAEITGTDRVKAVEAARRAYFAELALKSVASRRKAKEARQAAEQLEAEAAAADTELADLGGEHA